MFTLDQLRSSECKVACGFIGGSDGGVYWKDFCYCYNKIDYYEVTNRKRYYLPKKAKTNLVAPSYSDPPKESAPSYRGYPKELDEFLF